MVVCTFFLPASSRGPWPSLCSGPPTSGPQQPSGFSPFSLTFRFLQCPQCHTHTNAHMACPWVQHSPAFLHPTPSFREGYRCLCSMARSSEVTRKVSAQMLDHKARPAGLGTPKSAVRQTERRGTDRPRAGVKPGCRPHETRWPPREFTCLEHQRARHALKRPRHPLLGRFCLGGAGKSHFS